MKRYRDLHSPDEILSISSNKGSIVNKYEYGVATEAEVLADCEVWLDGKDASSFTLDGTSVDQWDDKSGNDRHVLNGNADATRPTYDVSTGRVTFTSANSTFLQSAAFGSALSQPNTVFIVYKINTYANNTIIFDGESTGRNVIFMITNNFAIFSGVVLDDGAINLNDNIHVGLFNGLNSKYWINGISVVTGNANTAGLNGITLGARYDLTASSNCAIMEVIVYNSDISDYKRIKINNYLAGKWGINALTPFPLTASNIDVFKEGELRSMKFNGSTSKIDCNEPDTLIGNKTFIAWAKPYGYTNGDYTIIDNGSLKLRAGSDHSWLFISNSPTFAKSADNAFVEGKWQLVVVTRSDTGITNIYVDGELTGTANQGSGNPIAGTYNVMIGARSADGGKQFNRLLESVRVIDGLLTKEEISQIYSSEKKIHV